MENLKSLFDRTWDALTREGYYPRLTEKGELKAFDPVTEFDRWVSPSWLTDKGICQTAGEAEEILSFYKE